MGKVKKVVFKRMSVYPIFNDDQGELRKLIEETLKSHAEKKYGHLVFKIKKGESESMVYYKIREKNQRFDCYFGATPILSGHPKETNKEFAISNLEMSAFEFDIVMKAKLKIKD